MTETRLAAQAQRILGELRFSPIDLTQIDPNFGYLLAKNCDFEIVIGQIQNTLRDISK